MHSVYKMIRSGFKSGLPPRHSTSSATQSKSLNLLEQWYQTQIEKESYIDLENLNLALSILYCIFIYFVKFVILIWLSY